VSYKPLGIKQYFSPSPTFSYSQFPGQALLVPSSSLYFPLSGPSRTSSHGLQPAGAVVVSAGAAVVLAGPAVVLAGPAVVLAGPAVVLAGPAVVVAGPAVVVAGAAVVAVGQL